MQEFTSILLIIVVILASHILMPKRIMAFLSKIHGLSPNWITVWRVLIFYLGVYFAFDYEILWAVVFLTNALIMDFDDGHWARSHNNLKPGSMPKCKVFAENPCLATFWQELNYPGETSIGEWLDPLADKLKANPGLLMFVVLSPYNWVWVLISIVMFLAILFAEVLGSVIRPPFKTTLQVKEAEKTWMRGAKATGIGKAKTTLMFLGFALFVFRFWGFYSGKWFIPELFFVFCVPLSWLSVLSKTRLAFVLKKINKEKTGKRIDRWVDNSTRFFQF